MSNEYNDWMIDKIQEERAIVEKYPFLHIRDIDGNIDTKSKFPMILLEIPDGWRRLFFSMCNEIRPILIKEGKLYDFYFIQVKEKYGDLRCYYCGDTPKEVEDIIHMYENVAYCFCIDCGNVAILRSDGRREPFCKECRDKRLGKV